MTDQTTPEQMIAMLRAKLPEGAPAVKIHANRQLNEYDGMEPQTRFDLCLFDVGVNDKLLVHAFHEPTAEDAIRVVLLQLSVKWAHLGLLAVQAKCEQVESEGA